MILRIIVIAVLCFPALLSPCALSAEEVYLQFRDLQRARSGQWVSQGLRLPPQNPSLPIVREDEASPSSDLLRSLDARGLANGFDGILYDNRDRGHSALSSELFPRLHHLNYGLELEADNADLGLAGAIIHNEVVFGNSSMAIAGGPLARSLSRLAMTSPRLAQQSSRLYENNGIYIYPEHRDYDEVDRYPARWPYHIISQGSSGSDQPFLRAVGSALAAFRRDTMNFMKERGLVAPTVEMILRRNQKQVVVPDDFFEGAVHRPVIHSSQLRPERMVQHAAALGPEDIPPVVRLRVIEEDFSDAAGLAGMSEKLFDTPSAIARLWRGFESTKSILVSVGDTKDPNGKPLVFSWHLLQGDPEGVRFEFSDSERGIARIWVDWQNSIEIPADHESESAHRSSSRVDIGVFASTGRSVSAPAIVSVSFPTHQVRRYEESPEHGRRLASVDYNAQTRGEYFDPLLYWSADWTDVALYSPEGELTGWRRSFPDRAGAITVLIANTPLGSYIIDEAPGFPTLRFDK